MGGNGTGGVVIFFIDDAAAAILPPLRQTFVISLLLFSFVEIFSSHVISSFPSSFITLRNTYVLVEYVTMNNRRPLVEMRL